MKKDTTGYEHFGFALTPPFPLVELVDLINRDLKPSEEEQSVLRSLLEKKLPPLIRTEILPLILGISPKLVFAMSHVPEKYYRRFKLAKRGGGTREIATPRIFLKVVQRWILINILYRHSLPEFVTGFVPGKGILANAKLHVGRKYILRLDIKDFFPSIGSRQVREVYSRIGYPERISALLTGLSTLRGVLPQGAPTSPYVANLVFLPCDLEISAIAQRAGLSYSRYADDLTFSSDKPISQNAIQEVRRSITRARFTVNEEKVKSAGPGQRLLTTGLVVNVKVHPMRSLRRRLRARFHQASLEPRRFVKQAHELLGWAAYVNSYDTVRGVEYLRIANEIVVLSQKIKR